jgi:3'(2'), 5'-bisphosphate nucleotidase
MPSAFEHEREVAIRAVREAASLCRAVRGGIAPESMAKADLSPVTVADFGSQALICRTLAESMPGDPVVAEEDSADLRRPENERLLDQVLDHVRAIRSEADPEDVCRWIDRGEERGYAPRFWTLDPIDGTKGYLRGGQYAIALALIVEGRVEVAALACPNLPMDRGDAGPRGAVFVAVRGEGSSVQPLDGGAPPVAIHVSPTAESSSARFCESVESGHSSHSDAEAIAEQLGIHAPPERLDSQAKYAVVARGEAEIYLRLPTRADYREKIWDHAAGALVVAEAGGNVTDLDGRPLEFHHGPELSANRGVIVTNGLLHRDVLAAVRAVGL